MENLVQKHQLTGVHKGFIGRFLARHLHENGLASEVRIVDKQLPQLAWLAPEFEEACCRAAQFVQGDMSRDRTPPPCPTSHSAR